MAKSDFEVCYCHNCSKHTKHKYLGKSRESSNDILPFLKWKLFECTECGNITKE